MDSTELKMDELVSQYNICRIVVMTDKDDSEEKAMEMAAKVGTILYKHKCQEGYVCLVQTETEIDQMFGGTDEN